MSQSEIADLIASAGVSGATRQSQSLYEKGKRAPDAAYLAVIASAGVDVGYVLTGVRTPDDVLHNVRLAAEITLTAGMTDEQRAELIGMHVEMARAAPGAVAERAGQYTTSNRLRKDQLALLDAYERCSPDARSAALKLLASAAQQQRENR